MTERMTAAAVRAAKGRERPVSVAGLADLRNDADALVARVE
jgi:hypothetical protein